MNKRFIMTIGMPYSGKSTFAAAYKAQEDWLVVERDVLLPEITKSQGWHDRVVALCKERGIDHEDLQENFPVRNEVAIEMLNEKVAEIVEQSADRNILYDGTNLQGDARAVLIKKIELETDRNITGVYFDIPFEVLKERAENTSREGFNADAAKRLEQMRAMFDAPTANEGFTELQTITLKDQNESTEEQRMPLR